jgi:hypothetical protein
MTQSLYDAAIYAFKRIIGAAMCSVARQVMLFCATAVAATRECSGWNLCVNAKNKRLNHCRCPSICTEKYHEVLNY